MRRFAPALLLLALHAGPSAAQTGSRSEAPFAPGERLQYSVGYGILPAGTMELRLVGLERVGGRVAYHATSSAESNRAVSFLYELVSNEESWFDAERFHSLRYRRRTVENDEPRVKEVRFDQAARTRTVVDEDGSESHPASPNAVDQLAMLYYIRTLPLETGARFVLRNQADPADNPITIRVLKEERVRVPAGTYETFVLDLQVKTDNGVFKKGGENRVWVTSDHRHVPVRISSKIGIGSFQAELVSFRAGG